jgi:CubicO group peptidase (beta-lactamase class C family)
VGGARGTGRPVIETPIERLRQVLAAARADGTVPGAAVAAGIGPAEVVRELCGGAGDDGPTSADTLFDLASLTKVMATTPTVLALHDSGELSVDDPLGRYVPAFAAGDRAGIRLRHLLTHTAGLLASRRYYRTVSTRDEVLAAVAAEPLVAAPGTRVVYSDLGFLLLGQVIEVVTGARLDEAVRARVLAPLGLARTGYRPTADPGLAALPLAPTDEPGSAPTPGRPHDRNAQACGDVAGHAGLFSTLDDVAAYGAWWAGSDGGPVSSATRAEAVRCATEGLGGRRGQGWLCRGDRDDFLAGAWGPTAVMHTGFTGTSLAVDPTRGWWAVLLTNAVHLGRDRPAVPALRTEVHRLLAEVLAGVGKAQDSP